VLGLLLLTLGPMVASAYISFTAYPLLAPPKFVGLRNYIDLFTKDKLFYQSLKVTFSYAVMALPLGLILSLLAALLLNQKVRGIRFFRTFFYVPSIVPAVASAVLWGWLLNPDWGLVNAVLKSMGLPTSRWLSEPETALPSLVLISLWGIGGTTIIYLAGLQSIPEELYEAAKIDGGNTWHLFWFVTIPLLTPTIFFNLVMGLIGTFQYFAPVYILTNGTGGPVRSTYFYNLNLYEKAFRWLQMGYASAMAWVLFVIVLCFTLLIFRSSSVWVYYEGEVKR
jgi:multiple sugar transport system permease protein